MDESLVEMYKYLIVFVFETVMNKAEHEVCLFHFLHQVFGKMADVLESDTHIVLGVNLVDFHPCLP